LGGAPESVVFVVDNGSTDDTLKQISEFPSVRLIQGHGNIGFGRANNLGVRAALDIGADSVFLLNQDAWVEEGGLDRLSALQSKHPCFGILSPIHLDGTGTRLDQDFGVNLCRQEDVDLVSKLFCESRSLQEVYPFRYVNAAAWLVSRACLEKVGGFDPLFFHYGEDENYCQRARYHGFEIGVCPSAQVFHDRADRPATVWTEYRILTCLVMELADIQIPDDEVQRRVRSMSRLNFKIAIREVLCGRWQEAQSNLRRNRMLKSLWPHVASSRKRTSQKGCHYIYDEIIPSPLSPPNIDRLGKVG
jgi:GT2 family glycosyltransferase